jgi:hypothetical protein
MFGDNQPEDKQAHALCRLKCSKEVTPEIEEFIT